MFPYDLVNIASRSLARGQVDEFQDEGNNIANRLLPITLPPAPDLQVTALTIPERANPGQSIAVNYTVTNAGTDVPASMTDWNDLIYFSRDQFLDLKADRYVATVPHHNGLSAGGTYSIATQVQVPSDLIGPWYVFVITDPPGNLPIGNVFENDKESNNARASDLPLVIEQPPASDIVVTSIDIPSTGKPGEPVTIRWTVQNVSQQPAIGSWSDAAYLADTATWDVSDPFLGRMNFTGTLLPGQTYTATLNTVLPSVTPGPYRVIVRPNAQRQLYEGPDGILNNSTPSADTLLVAVDTLTLGVPLPITLSSEQSRLYQITVPLGATLRVKLDSAADSAANELYLRHASAPTSSTFDAAYQGVLAADQVALIPSTQSGIYYILVRGHSEPADNTPATLLAELLPLSISDVKTDFGGDAQFVTTAITGAQFKPGAIVKLIRPGIQEYAPVAIQVVDSTKILATFDLTGAPHGLYDVKVINPDGSTAIVPYRFQIEQALPAEVTIGVGGPRFILAGDTGTYSVALQNLGNVDAPYVAFTVGIPEMGLSPYLYSLPYVQFFSNVGGGPTTGPAAGVSLASLGSAVNTNGFIQAPGYLFDEHAGGFTGFTFDVTTYPGLKELHDHAFNALRDRLYAQRPDLAAQGVLDGPDGVANLDLFAPGLSQFYSAFGMIPDFPRYPFIPFQFNLVAAATALTRDEFIARQLQQADTLRAAILADPTASGSLLALAADQTTWETMYLAALEQSGLLLPDGATPPLLENPVIASVMATLASGILAGPAGNSVQASLSLTDFFTKVHQWYGDAPGTPAPLDGTYNANPLPSLAQFADYDLHAAAPTTFENFRVYVPWIPFEARGQGLPPSYQIVGVDLTGGQAFVPLNLAQFQQGNAASNGLISVSGPYAGDSDGFLPINQSLPFTINFQNDPQANSTPAEVRVVTTLDPALDATTFRLGSIKIGNISLQVPDNRGLFQGDFEFTRSNGFILRVSAGVDLATHTATWLLQAIDPITGELIADPAKGLLPPNNAQGAGAGYVSYTIFPRDDAASGTALSAQARLLFNNAPPADSATLNYQLDATAPTTQLSVTPLAGGNNYQLVWTSADDAAGSGADHVTIYVATDGDSYKILQSQVTDTTGTLIYQGQAGHSYQFLVLGTDKAGNRETPPFGVHAPQADGPTNLGTLPTVEQSTLPNFGIPPTPAPQPSTNPLFLLAQQQIPSAPPNGAPPAEFTTVLRPFTAEAFATGFATSGAGIGPLALAQAPDGTILVSGGAFRNELYRFNPLTGGTADNASRFATLDQPISNLAFDSQGRLWGVTLGGPLVQIDPASGAILARYGDGLDIALAIQPHTDLIYVSSGQGVEIFDPASQTFRHYSRDQNLRVSSLAFAPDGSLWGVSWPDRRQAVEFDDHARAQVIFTFDSDIDSLVFGQPNTPLENLLFVSHNAGAGVPEGTPNPAGSELTMIDTATLSQLTVAQNGTRGGVLLATAAGQLLISQSHQVDVLDPIVPPSVIATNPPAQAVAVLPLGVLSVVFDRDMLVAGTTDDRSVINPQNYTLIGDNVHQVAIQQVLYDPGSRTALLLVSGLTADHYMLTVRDTVQSAALVPLAADYSTEFRAVGNLAGLIAFQFFHSRSDRTTGTVSWDVKVTNSSNFNLLLPLILTLDPEAGYPGVPANAAGRAADGRWLVDLSNVLPNGILAPGATTIGQTVTIANPNNLRVNFSSSVSAQTPPLAPPVFDTQPPTDATIGQLYQYAIAAHDPLNGTVQYALDRFPAGMGLDSQTGLITWTPTDASPAQVTVILEAITALGSHASQTFVINVAGGNHLPVFQSLPPVIQRAEGQTLVLPVSATDADNNPLVYWADNLPPGATFNAATHTLLYAPGFHAAGSYNNVTLFVSDGKSQVSTSVTILVSPTTQPPTLAKPADRVLAEGDPLRFTLLGKQADGLTVTYSADGLPPGATLDPNTGVFQWIPAYNQVGSFEVAFTAHSGSLNSPTQRVRFTVTQVNVAPVFGPLAGFAAAEGQSLIFQPLAIDPNNPDFIPPTRLSDGSLAPLAGSPPSVTYTVAGLPRGATFDPDTVTFAWTPDYFSAGQYFITFTATKPASGNGPTLSSSVTVPIQVTNVNRPPIITPIASFTIHRGEVLDLNMRASDLDVEPLTLTAASALPGFPLPRFASFVDHGSGTGTIHFAPDVGDSGNYALEFTATDQGAGDPQGVHLTTSYSFVVTVSADNEPPTLDFVGDKVAIVGTPFSLTIQAHDFEQELLDYALAGLPASATLMATNIYGQAVLTWTPTPSDLGNHPVTLTVTDHGNGQPALVASASRQIQIKVVSTDTAPTLDAVGPQTIDERQALSFTLAAQDPGDPITYVAQGLPDGATLDPQTGVFHWTPRQGQAGNYAFTVLASDGSLSASRPISIAVNRIDTLPQLAATAPQLAREGSLLQFTVAGADPDGDTVTLLAAAGLPLGATFNPTTGVFRWIPGFTQAGDYTITFGIRDSHNNLATTDVQVHVADVRRAPVLHTSNHSATLGQLLSFNVLADNLDADTALVYAADHLPLGATLNPTTGVFSWVPGPGQVGDYIVTLRAANGNAAAAQDILIRAALAPQKPIVTIELTPSFPVLPNNPVLVHVAGASLATIASLQLTVNGQAVALDAQGSAKVTPTSPGKLLLAAIATDADGLVGTATSQVKVLDPANTVAPEVAINPAPIAGKLQTTAAILGTVNSSNLDFWRLEIALQGTSQFALLGSGGTSVNDGPLALIDPAALANGFYTLRLTAADIAGRTTTTQAELEIGTSTKPTAYQISETDATVSLGGISVGLTRYYDSQTAGTSGEFGNGWSLLPREVNLQTSVTATGREALGLFAPFETGTRVYLTLPTGQRAGFTFAPHFVRVQGLDFYIPEWQADAGVTYALQSVSANLTRAGNHYYDRATGQPYNPANPFFGEPGYTLVAADGTRYQIDPARGVIGQTSSTGGQLFISDSGIVAANGEAIEFEHDEQGRIVCIDLPNGNEIRYAYDAAGNLISATNASSGESKLYGYDQAQAGRLTLAIRNDGDSQLIQYGASPPTTVPVPIDLGSVSQFTGHPQPAVLPYEASDLYAFHISPSELQTTAAGMLILRVAVRGTPAVTVPEGTIPMLNPGTPLIAGLELLSIANDGQQAVALYAVRQSGVYAVQVVGANADAGGNYEIELSVAGDLNADAAIDGADSQLLAAALGTNAGDAAYVAAADIDGDGAINSTDRQVLIDNYGFVTDTASSQLPPARPIFDLEPGFDTAPLGDQRTILTSVTLVGRTDPDTVVQLDATGQTYNVGCSGLFYFADVPLTMGDNPFTITATSASGQTSQAMAIITRGGPGVSTSPPVITARLSHDTADPLDGITSDDTIAGSIAHVGQLTALRASIDGLPMASVFSFLSGDNFALHPTVLAALNGGPLADGTHTIRFAAADEFGNRSAIASLSFVLDTTAPDAPPSPELISAATASNLTNAASPSLRVTAAAGNTIRLYLNGNFIKQAANFAGSVTFSVGPLADGTYHFTADAVDPAGNASLRSAALDITIDTRLPAVPTLDLALASDTPPLGDTQTTLELVTLTGSTDPNITVTLRRAVNFDTPIATTTSDGTGNFSFVGIALASGPNGFRVVAQSAAGNSSRLDRTFTTSALDTTAPTISASLVRDTGRDLQDSLTFDATIQGFVDDASQVTAFQASLDGHAAFDVLPYLQGAAFRFTAADLAKIAAPSLTDGPHSLALTARDQYGNGNSAFSLSFNLDTGRPVAPTLSLLASDDTGPSSHDGITKIATLHIDADAESGAIVRLYLDGIQVGQQIAAGPLEFPVGSLPDGQHTFTAQAEDNAGNISIFSVPLLVTVDTTPPVVPTFDLDAASDTRPYGDHATNLPNVRLTGKTDPNSAIKLVETGEIVTADSQGKFSFYPISLDDSKDFAFTMQATDLAGNTSQFTRTVTRADIAETDLLRPEVTLDVSQKTGLVGTTVTLTVHAADNVSVASKHLLIDGQEVTLDANGQATFSSATPGIFTAKATAYDPAGNEGDASEEIKFQLPADPNLAPPIAALTDPSATPTATMPIDVLGTAQSDNLLRYVLEYPSKAKTSGPASPPANKRWPTEIGRF